jgi:hypothetical protein
MAEKEKITACDTPACKNYSCPKKFRYDHIRIAEALGMKLVAESALNCPDYSE